MKAVAIVLFLAPLALLHCARPENARAQTAARPKLILFIAIDQFRADYLMRFQSRFLPAFGKSGEIGGFQYLMSQGAYYPYGEYGLLQSMTGPGHATLLTGSYPYQNGIPINYWYDPSRQEGVYCVEDPSSTNVGAPTPAHAGTSPRNLIASTVGDELKNAGYGSRVYSIALKDRAAILMGGHRADLALWFDPAQSKWISSRYYLPSQELPSWVNSLNESVQSHADELIKQFSVWRPEGPGTGYSVESSPPFAHPLVIHKEEALHSPYGGELTEQAAEAAFDAMALGRGKAPTDLLAVSFSSHDWVGHEFGPNSLEMEEITISEDRQIAKLLNHVRSRMPLEDTVIVLTADHGIPELPEYASSVKLPSGRIDEEDLKNGVEDRFTALYGPPPKGQKWVSFVADLNFYLNREALEKRKIPYPRALAVAKTTLENRISILYVATPAYGENGPPLQGILAKQYEHSFMRGRSGDLIGIPKPGFMAGGNSGVNHHTGYSYDRTVPIILAGSRFFRAGIHAEEARVIDIAPTLSFISGIVPPNMSEGRVLSESLEKIH